MNIFKFNLTVILLVFIVGLIPLFSEDTVILSSISKEIIISLLAVSISVNIPYDKIGSKCISIGFTLIQLSNLAIYLVHYFYEFQFKISYILICFSLVFLSSIFFAFQLSHRYSFKSDMIDDSYVYYLCPKTDDFTGLISALFYYPFSGVKVYCKGNVYAYNKGELKKFTGRRALFYISKCYSFNTKVRSSQSIETELDNLVGLKWSYYNNCYTTFEPLFGDLKSKLK